MKRPRRQTGPERLYREFAEPALPGLELLGRYDYRQARREGLHVHRHPGCIEICYLERGRQLYSLGAQRFVMEGGDVFLTFPDEPHSTGGQPEEKGVLYWLIVRLDPPGASFLHLPAGEAASLRQALLGLPARLFRGDAALRDDLDAAIAACLAQADPLRTLRLRTAISSFLLGVAACGQAAARPRHSPPIAAALACGEARPGRQLAVSDLAAAAGLSLSRFKTRFKQELGVPPGEYLTRRRVELAKTRLAQRRIGITALAFELGFSSSQYFATVFRRYTGCSPSAWRRRAKG